MTHDFRALRQTGDRARAALEAYVAAASDIVDADGGADERRGAAMDALANACDQAREAAARIAYFPRRLPDSEDDPATTRVQAILDREADVERLARVIAPDLAPRAFAAARPFLTAVGVTELGRATDALRPAAQALSHAFDAVAATLGGPTPSHPQETLAMSSSTTPPGDDLANAVSRLQGAGAFGAPSVGFIGDFDRHVAQRIGATLGLPDLRGETARGSDPAELLAKLRAGLDRSVTRGAEAGETRWRFDPIRARGGLDTGPVAGGQGVILRTVRALRVPFVQALHDIGSERHRADWAERDELRAAAEAGFDALIHEAGQPTGPYLPAVEAAARQVANDVLTLAALGDVIEHGTPWFVPFTDRIAVVGGGGLTLADGQFDGPDDPGAPEGAAPSRPDPDWDVWRLLLSQGEVAAVEALVIGAEAEAATRDPDLGLLDPEANEAALVAALGHLRSVYGLLTRDLGRAGTLGRARIRNDALAQSAATAGGALVAVGLSAADQAAITAGGARIDVGRLLAWIADSAQADRTLLSRDDVSATDLTRILRVRATQLSPMEALIDAPLPGIPRNPFAAGRRELTEVATHLRDLVGSLETLAGPAGLPKPAREDA